MRLWARNEAPVGGWYYLLDDGTKVTAISLDTLISAVDQKMKGLDMEVPQFLGELVEDQICQRQPSGKCRYSKALGDLLSNGITGVAGAIDKVLGTNLAPRARGCSKCGKRRVKLNNL